ncbi:hypothetical protein ACFQ0D_25775, partial [Micromonospora zhanjiangensis]
HRALPVAAGRVEVDLTLARHEVTLVELTPVVDRAPPWWDADNLLDPPAGTSPVEGTAER